MEQRLCADSVLLEGLSGQGRAGAGVLGVLSGHLRRRWRLIACQQDHPDSRLDNVDDLATDPPSACFLLLPVPTFAQVTRPSSRGSQSPSKMSRLIRLTSTYKKRGAPDCFFCWLLLGFRFWQAGAWQRIKDESKDLRQDTTRPSAPLSAMQLPPRACLLGETATAFCRHGQLERPGDVICEGIRSISAAQAPSTSAHPFARSLSFT